MRVRLAALLALLAVPAAIQTAAAPAQAADGRIAVVAAENFYGEIARDIGGVHVTVTSIMSNPDQDPHLFETTPGVVKRIADAQIVILNGANYDPWMPKLMQAAPRPNRVVIDAGEVTGAKAGGNPHLWYAPATMPAVAKAIAAAFGKTDSAHAADYAANLDKTLAQLARITQRVGQLRAKHQGKAVTATEPVFGLMAEAAGLTMRNEKFQLAMMNDTEPSARDLAAFEDDLKNHKVKAMIYNKQVSEKLTDRLVTIARTAKVPVVAVTETMPGGITFTDWMLGELDALDKALDGGNS